MRLESTDMKKHHAVIQFKAEYIKDQTKSTKSVEVNRHDVF